MAWRRRTSSERMFPNKRELSYSEFIENSPSIQHAAGYIVAIYNPICHSNALAL